MNERKRSILEDKWAAQEADESRHDSADEAEAGKPGGDPEGDPADEELQRLRDEVAALQEQLVRKQAELVNFRRRTERERQERLEAERAAVIRQLLPVIDDFERAIATEPGDVDAYREGVELILRSLHETLGRMGVERISPEGQEFDPHLHEAVDRRETSEVPEGHVAEIYKPGYRLGSRLVRAATVSVAARPRDDDASEGGS